MQHWDEILTEKYREISRKITHVTNVSSNRPRVRNKMRNNKKSNFTFGCKIASKTSKERKKGRKKSKRWKGLRACQRLYNGRSAGVFSRVEFHSLPKKARKGFWIGSRNRYLTASNLFSFSFPETTSEEDGTFTLMPREKREMDLRTGRRADSFAVSLCFVAN